MHLAIIHTKVIKTALKESGLMSSIKIDSACTDETTDYKSKQMSRLGRGETPFQQLSNALLLRLP